MQKINTYLHAHCHKVYPHVAVILLFFALTVAFFYPIFFEGKSIQQADIQQYRGSVAGIQKHTQETGEQAIWNPWIFSGMPTYVSGISWEHAILRGLHDFFTGYLPHPVWTLFSTLLWSYVLLLCFGTRPLVALCGAIVYGLSSYFFVGLGAGHNARMGAMSYIPMILAGVRLAYGERWFIGGILCAFGIAFQLLANHIQMTYYTLFAVLFYATAQCYPAYKEKQLKRFVLRSSLLLVAGIIGFSTYYGQFKALYTYSKHSTRGEHILNLKENEEKVGLNKEEAFTYSNSPMESMTLLIPNFYGGQFQEPLTARSHTAKALRERNQPAHLLSYAYTYWGDQPITTPYYAGAVAFFFVLLGVQLTGRRMYWLFALGFFALLLTWGKHIAWFNHLLFDFLPGFNKFRSHTFATVLILLVYALIGGIGLEKSLQMGFNAAWRRIFWKALIGAVGLLLLVLLFAGLGGYEAPIDGRLQQSGIPPWYLRALRADRLSLLRADTWRSLFFVLAAAALLYLISVQKLRQTWGIVMLTGLLFLDVVAVSTRYFQPKKNSSVNKPVPYPSTEASRYIQADTAEQYRVFHLKNPFSENSTSTYHRSIGGYHAVKLRRYQDIITHGLARERTHLIQAARQGNLKRKQPPTPISDMLNVRYFIFGDVKKDVLRNASPCGPAWLVSRVLSVASPDEEIAALKKINPCTTATWDTSQAPLLQGNNYQATGTVALKKYTPNEVRYQVKNAGQACLVMAEIHYPDWVAYVNGKQQPLLRVNYLLRGLVLPAGTHDIRLTARFDHYLAGQRWKTVGSVTLLILLLTGLVGGGYTAYRQLRFAKT